MKLNLLKKLFSVTLTTTFLLSLNIVPANAFNLTDGKYNCSTGSLDNSLSSNFIEIDSDIVRGNDCGIGSVNIPDGVVEIEADAFSFNTLITSVTIPDSVLTIGSEAFTDCTSLTSVTIGNRVTSIGVGAFVGTNLTSLVIPNSVTEIGNRAFQQVPLTSLTLGNQLTRIGNDAFAVSRITTLVIPDSVISIGAFAFDSAPLTRLTLGNSLTTIGPRAFHSGPLTSVTFPASLTTIGLEAFMFSTLLFNVNFLGNVPITVGTNAFLGVATGAKANVAYNATGFPANGSTWNNLVVTYGSAPAENSGSTTASVTTPKVAKNPDAVFNLKNKKYLSKYAMKEKLSKNKSFKRSPEDLYKYSIFKASKKTCAIQGNYVTGLKKTGTCDLYATRTTTKGVKYKYWVQINYTK
jgi:hypothetical protein